MRPSSPFRMWHTTSSTQFLTTVNAVVSRRYNQLVCRTRFTNFCWFIFPAMRSDCEPCYSTLRNLKLSSTLWTRHVVSWLFVSAVMLKTIQTERMNARQQPRVLKFVLTYQTRFTCTGRHSVGVADILNSHEPIAMLQPNTKVHIWYSVLYTAICRLVVSITKLFRPSQVICRGSSQIVPLLYVTVLIHCYLRH